MSLKSIAFADHQLNWTVPTPTPDTTIAALDLGSNSFHMIVAAVRADGLVILDRLREMVQLAHGLEDGSRLAPDAIDRALACLSRFGDRLRAFEPRSVRAVGTNALRKASNAKEFLPKAELALGHPIHVISGTEEARLIYAGVTYGLPRNTDSRLVVDIGGGSTEFILGKGLEPTELASVGVGCVGLTERYFRCGQAGAAPVLAAEQHVMQKLEPLISRFSNSNWGEAIGASGSVHAIANVAERLGASADRISRDALLKIKSRLSEQKRLDNVTLPGLSSDRRQIFTGGFVALSAIFNVLELNEIKVSTGALREGLLLDLVGRLSEQDVRNTTVNNLAIRFRVDLSQAERVCTTAESLLDGCGSGWIDGGSEERLFMLWAAKLHEIGLAVAHSGYHRHGAYLIEHADLAGFAQEEQQRLATLVMAQRKPFPDAAFKCLPKRWRRATRRLSVILRLSILMNRARVGNGRLPVSFAAKGKELTMSFPPGWLEKHPLCEADLEKERQTLARSGFRMNYT